jgi:hypothetical protein
MKPCVIGVSLRKKPYFELWFPNKEALKAAAQQNRKEMIGPRTWRDGASLRIATAEQWAQLLLRVVINDPDVLFESDDDPHQQGA